MLRRYFSRVVSGCWILFSLAILAGCAGSSTRVDTTYDPGADFSEFRTFGFADPLGTDRRGARTSLSNQLVVATIRELQARGMQPVGSNPDLLIDFYLAQQTAIENAGPFMHTHGSVSTWRGYDTRTSMSLRFSEGTLAIDVVDARRGALVFEGMAEGRITEAMRDNLGETVGEVVAEVFAGMP